MNNEKERLNGEPGKNMYEQVWAFLSSMRVGIALLLLLTGMSVYGSTFMGHQEALEKVYGSWWFLATLAVTGINLLVCSINRWEHIWRRVTVLDTGAGYKTLDRYKEKEYLPLRGTPEDSAARLHEFMGQKGYRAAVTSEGEKILVSSDKGRFGYFGSLVTHISLILLLLASLYGILSGFETFDGGFQGRLFGIPEADFGIRIDDFEIKYRDDYSIEQYYSTLTVLENGREVKQETIFVNRPLRHKGVALYQSTWGWGIKFRFAHPGTGVEAQELILRPGQVYQHPETGIRFYFMEFFPDFTMTQMGAPFNRSDKPVNPRVAFSFYDAAGQLLGQQYYLERPDARVELPEGYVLEFLGWQNYTGFQIVKNPGKPLALFASLMMIAGLVMSFYLFPRRVWAYIGPETEGKVLVAGRSRRNKVGFELEFKRLMQDLKKGWEE